MSTTLSAENYATANQKARTTYTADVAAGQTVIGVQNVNDFATNDPVISGTFGVESCEMNIVSSITGQNITLTSVTTQLHRRMEPLVALRGNQIRFYRAPNTNGYEPPVGNFVELTTLSLNTDALTTEYVDSSGSSEFWYKFTYRNSITGNETDLATAPATRGAEYGHYCTIEDIRIEAGFKNATYITDQQIDLQRRRAESEMNSYLTKLFSLPFSEPFPPLLENISRVLSAGYLMLVEYGTQTDTKVAAKNGQNKVNWAQGMLTNLTNGKMPLLDVFGNNITQYSEYGNFPTDLTQPVFKIGKTY